MSYSNEKLLGEIDIILSLKLQRKKNKQDVGKKVNFEWIYLI